MKKFLLLIFFIAWITGLSQPADTARKVQGIPVDSAIKEQKTTKDSIPGNRYGYDTDPSTISRNLDSLLRLQKEQRAKQKKAAMIRIAIGVAFLAVLIIGLRRRKKQGSTS